MSAKTAIVLTVIGAALLAGGVMIVQRNTPTATAKTAALSGDQICSRDLKQHVQFNDPDSVRINSVVPGDGDGKPWFKMSVSAKNAFGGYGDPVPCSCVPDVAANKVTYLYCSKS